MDKSTIRDFFLGILRAFPGRMFFIRMFYFIKRPEMLDGEWELSPLKHAGENIFSSLVLVVGTSTIVNHLLANSGVMSFPSVINPAYLTLNMTIDAVIFAVIFWLVLAALSNFKSKGTYFIYFLQVLQTYSVVNFLIVGMFWVYMQMTVTQQFLHLEPSFLTLVLAGSMAVLAFGASIWLLVFPVVKYVSTYYSRFLSWCFVGAALTATLTLNQHVKIPIGSDLIINKLNFCEYLFKVKSEQEPQLESMKSCIIGQCVSGMDES